MPKLLEGDCLEVLKELADNSIDSVVCDPPYDLTDGGKKGFMGKAWDATGVAFRPDVWRECLRVMKPGGHLLAFGGTRTYHRMAVAIEDAGFEIRDSIHWMYGSGFPKSLDVSKSIDKRGGVTVGWFGPWLKEERERRGMTRKELAVHFPSQQKYAGKEASGGLTGCVGNWETGVSLPTVEQFNKLCDVLNLPFNRLEEAEREVLQARTMIQGGGTAYELRMGERREVDASITAPATDAARQWEGWGTALKPSHEPIVVARKPLIGTVAENLLIHGTGAINIDDCRVGNFKCKPSSVSTAENKTYGKILRDDGLRPTGSGFETDKGRWPPNAVFSHLPECENGDCEDGCAVMELNRQSDERGVHAAGTVYSTDGSRLSDTTEGAARFFPAFRYQAKASDRNDGLENVNLENTHPTVKPVDLMIWLVRLVTPPNGIVLDPFMGSGSTGVAAVEGGFDFIGIELEPEYFRIASTRIEQTRARKFDFSILEELPQEE